MADKVSKRCLPSLYVFFFFSLPFFNFGINSVFVFFVWFETKLTVSSTILMMQWFFLLFHWILPGTYLLCLWLTLLSVLSDGYSGCFNSVLPFICQCMKRCFVLCWTVSVCDQHIWFSCFPLPSWLIWGIVPSVSSVYMWCSGITYFQEWVFVVCGVPMGLGPHLALPFSHFR